MNPFIQFLMALMQHAHAQQQHPGGGSGQNPGAAENFYRLQQLGRGRPMGRLGQSAGSEGTPQAVAARQWLMNNFFGNPGGQIRDPSGPDFGTNVYYGNKLVGPAMGMGQGGNAFGYREVNPNQQLNLMDQMFSGEGRTPFGGAIVQGGGGWGGGGGGGGPFPEAF